jgi:valyl-tRNA synthetase
VHVSPWPLAAELAPIPEPKTAGIWATAVEVVDLLRKAKADANKSMAAPISTACVTIKAEAIPALESALDDIERMLRIGQVNVVPGSGENFVPCVQVVFEEVVDQA